MADGVKAKSWKELDLLLPFHQLHRLVSWASLPPAVSFARVDPAGGPLARCGKDGGLRL